MAIHEDRLAVANQVIQALLPGHNIQLLAEEGNLYICYLRANREKKTLCRLVKNGLRFIYRGLPLGFTHECAIGLLVKWIKNEHSPHSTIKTWKGWCTDEIGMKPKEIVDILLKAGYPSKLMD